MTQITKALDEMESLMQGLSDDELLTVVRGICAYITVAKQAKNGPLTMKAPTFQMSQQTDFRVPPGNTFKAGEH